MFSYETNNLRVERIGSFAALRLDVANRPLNVFSLQVFAELERALDLVAGEAGIKALILTSGKKTGFAAGADLEMFAMVATAEQAEALSQMGQRIFDRLAALAMPTAALIHGVCLGGGLELALACDYRWVIDAPDTAAQIGFPEVELGLLPGWGGTQRLPRVVGLEKALKMILGARRLNAREALACGLVDGSLPGASTGLDELAGRLIRDGKRQRAGLPRRGLIQWLREGNPLGRWLILRGAAQILRTKVPDDMPGPWEALQAVRVGLAQGMEAGLAFERAASGRLAVTPACRNLVNLFFQRERARKLPASLNGVDAPKPARIGVVGAGAMGAGIAQLAAVRGLQVVIQEINDDALAAGWRKIEGLFQKAVERRLLTAEAARAKLAGIGKTTRWEGFGDADVVIEAVIENVEAKRAVFRELEQRLRPDAVLATNTSSLLVAALQDGAARPERVAGLHFFNPVHKMPLVEVVRGPATDDRSLAVLSQLAAALGKTPVIVQDGPGFLVNRILMPYLNEAVLLVAEGMPVPAVDRIMRRFGMPMGPLELLDQIGLDVAAHSARSMEPLTEGRYPPNPFFEQMRARGWLGQKSGTGFYRYRGARKHDNPQLHTVIPVSGAGSPDADPARDRMVLLMVNEAAACLASGIVADGETLDLAMVLGTGWAPHRGGPWRYAHDRGLDEINRRLTELAGLHGPRFELHPQIAATFSRDRQGSLGCSVS